MKAGSAQRGISLVELMVAMAISLVLLLGIVQILLGHRGSFDSQQALAGLQQRGRLASFVLENAIAYAGYYPIQTGMHQVPAPESVFSASVISGTNEDPSTSRAPDEDSDTIRIRFRAAGQLANCIGSQVGATHDTETADFKLRVDDDNDLVCTIYDAAGNASYTRNLISNVQTLQIRYGLDTDGDGSVDHYSNAPANWDDVRSVRVQLLLTSETRALPAATPQKYVFADGQTVKVNDRHARYMVDETIALRNLLP